jgi:hypothetical protein
MKDGVSRAFARSIFAKAELLRTTELAQRDRQRVLESISDDLKKFTDLIQAGVSDAALAQAERMGVDLRTVGWHDQPRFDPGRRVFVREHVVPVNHIRAACLEAESEEETARCLEEAKVAWVLREEDRMLTRLGFRTVRPNPRAAYQAAGISLSGLTDEARDTAAPPDP